MSRQELKDAFDAMRLRVFRLIACMFRVGVCLFVVSTFSCVLRGMFMFCFV